MKLRVKTKAACRKAGMALAATTLAAEAGAAEGQVRMPALSLARFQTAQIHLGTLPEPVAEGETPKPIPACQATLGFVDADGAPFVDQNGRPIERTVNVEPGKTRSLSLPSSVVFGEGSGLRALFRATARLGAPPDPDMPDPCAEAQLSVEVYDNFTGRTSVALGIPLEPVVPQP